MKHSLEVLHMASLPVSAAEVPYLFDEMQVPFSSIKMANWPCDYPYIPEVAFRIAWCEEGVALHYKVNEQSVRALYADDNGNVWTDSCVEFFVRNADSNVYYNMEFNCIGTVLVGVGDGRHGRRRLPLEKLEQIDRWASLGRTPFEEHCEPTLWEVAIVIPASVFEQHPISLEAGASIYANFYKCGDELTVPHFLSWNPIEVPSPDFHRPDFFGKLLLKD